MTQGNPSTRRLAAVATSKDAETKALTNADLGRLSVELARGNLISGKVAGELIAHRVAGADTWLLVAELTNMKRIAAQIEEVIDEADEHDLYRPEGRRPLRLASDDVPEDAMPRSVLRAAA